MIRLYPSLLFPLTRLHQSGWLLATLLLSTSVYAGDIQIEGAWARATKPGVDSASVFMFISSKQDAVLTGASSPAAKSVALRTMSHKGGMMKTLTLEAIPLPAGKRVDMTSIHNYHLTLKGLNGPLEAGTTVPLILNIEMADKQHVKVEIQAEVRPLKNSPQQSNADHAHH